MSKGNQKRQRLFKAQAVVDSSGQPVVVCPICLQKFPQSAIRATKSSEPELRIEHAPASAPGPGTERCLTCRRCNNERAFEARAGLDRYRRKGIGLSFDGLAGVASVAPSKVPGLIRASPVSPELLMYARKNEYLSELKTAYLVAFATLGYAYILHSNLDPIRHAILTGNLEFTPCMVQEIGSWLPHRVWIISGQFASVRVTMDAEHPTDAEGQHVVDLPWRRSPHDLYERLHPPIAVVGRRNVPLGDVEMYGWPAPLDLDRRWDVGAGTALLPSGEHVSIGLTPSALGETD